MRIPRGLAATIGTLAVTALVAVGCSTADDEPSSPESSEATDSAAASDATDATEPPQEPTVLAEPPASPKNGACYQLTLEQAMEATTDVKPRDCAKPHTAKTIAVGQVDALSAGHLLAIDSDRIQQEVATSCPKAVTGFIGGSEEEQRLSILAPAWFTPTLAESDAGADWYRCDVVAPVGDGRLAPLGEVKKGVLGTSEGRERFGICGTDAPGSQGFKRTLCSADHSWQAISTYDLPDGAWPNREKVEPIAESPCKDAALDLADSSLDYEWAFDWPSKAEWANGRRYGLCWAPVE